MIYFLALISSFFLSLLLTLIIKKAAVRLSILDFPNQERKIHKKPIPLLGGGAIFLSFFLILFFFSFFNRFILEGQIKEKHLIGLFLSGLILMVGGYLDDKYNLKPKFQIFCPLLAVIVVIASGIGITYIANPFGDLIFLDKYKFILFWFHGLPYRIFFLADLFTLIWLTGMMYTTKFLDGLDGLVPGITAIGSLIIFFLSLNPLIHQPETAILAIILAGSCLGFLVFNFYPAKIFLGEGGSLFTGFMLGSLSIIAGSKVATTILLFGLPILDVLWVIARRVFWEKKSPFLGDQKHLHFRLLNTGFSERQTVVILYFLSSFFGISALFLQSRGKLISFFILSSVMLILAIFLVYRVKGKNIFDKENKLS